MWDGAYKRTLAVNRKEIANEAATGFLSRYLSGPFTAIMSDAI